MSAALLSRVRDRVDGAKRAVSLRLDKAYSSSRSTVRPGSEFHSRWKMAVENARDIVSFGRLPEDSPPRLIATVLMEADESLDDLRLLVFARGITVIEFAAQDRRRGCSWRARDRWRNRSIGWVAA
jgi:hypothetical protein